jgi:membrane-associated protease RseP (regulator of RpoE activity)
MKAMRYLILTAVVALAGTWALADGPGRVITTGPAFPGESLPQPPAVEVAPLPFGPAMTPPPPPGAPLPPAPPGIWVQPGQPGAAAPPLGGQGGAGSVWISIPNLPGASMPPPGTPGDVFTFSGRPGPVQKAKVAYLGVATSPANELLADQLKLGKGTGLVIDFVEEGSPAAKAGIRPHDVLVRLGDQILVNPPQLQVLVRLQKPGDKVTLTLVREAKEQKVTAELIEKEQVIGGEQPMPFWIQNVQPLRVPLNIQVEPQPPEQKGMTEHRAEIRREEAKRLAEQAKRFGEMAPPGTAHASVSASMADGEHTLTLTITDGKKVLVAKDKDGAVLFEGPVQTDEERAKVPPEVLKKLEKMEATTHFEIHMKTEGPHQQQEQIRRQGEELLKQLERKAPNHPPAGPQAPPMAM